jgi:hypothetical protein
MNLLLILFAILFVAVCASFIYTRKYQERYTNYPVRPVINNSGTYNVLNYAMGKY